MAALVTLTEAKRQCNVSDDLWNNVIDGLIDDASAEILLYLKSQGDSAWTPLTVPGQVRRATLILVAHYFEHRGDEMKTDADVREAIANILRQSRDPALA